jgi:GAF domain-containing protein
MFRISLAGTSSVRAFAELDESAIGDEPLRDILIRTADLTKAVLGVVVEASITLIDPDQATTAASTSEMASDLDRTQYALGYGPSLAAAEAGQLVSLTDTRIDDRWPEFARSATDHGVLSMLSVPLPVQRQVIGSLNMYAVESGSFSKEIIGLAERFGAYAAVAIANTTLYVSAADLAAQMGAAMSSRAVIEQAKGVLMGQRLCDADEAFDILVGLSQHSHRKLRHVAEALIEHTLIPGDAQRT